MPNILATPSQNRAMAPFTRSNVSIAFALVNTPPSPSATLRASSRKRSAPLRPLNVDNTSSAISSSVFSSGYSSFTSSQRTLFFSSFTVWLHCSESLRLSISPHRCVYSCTAVSAVATFGSRYMRPSFTKPYTSPPAVRRKRIWSVIFASFSLKIT